MKRVIIYIAFLFPFLMASCSEKEEIAANGNKEELKYTPFPINKGVNISSWLSQSDARGEQRRNYFTEAEVKQLAGFGFDHIRLPVDEEQLFTEDGQKIPEAFELMHNAIKWCKDANMRVLLDLHILRSHHFNNNNTMVIEQDNTPKLWKDKEAQYKYFELWKTLAEELKQYPNNFLAYELLNEPVALYASQWNSLSAQLIKQLRQAEPERKLIIGSNKWQGVNTFAELTVPANDPNIILSFHFYNPHLFTHYRAEWTDMNNLNVTIHYPGEIITKEDYNKLSDSDKKIVDPYMGTYNKANLTAMVQKAIDRAQKLGLQLHCGEFGCYNKTPRADKMNWMQDVVSIFHTNNIAYSYWDYKAGFGFCNSKGEVTDQEILNLLTK